MINIFTQKLWQFILLAIMLLPGTGCGTPTPDGISITAGPEIGSVSINGATIAYERYGQKDGKTVLLIAGTGNQLIDWPIELVEELVRRGYQVVRFDNRDSGLSTKFTEA